MKKRKIIAFVSIAILLIVVAFVLIGVYVLDETKDLRPGLVEFEDDGLFNEHTVRFYDSDDIDEIAHVYFRISEEYNGVNNITIQIWHEENTHLNELTLNFPNLISSRIMFVLPNGSWPPMEFGHTEDGLGCVVDISDFGIVGKATVLMNFRIQRSYGDGLKELPCYVDMQLSKDKGLKTIEYNAETNIEITIPGKLLLES